MNTNMTGLDLCVLVLWTKVASVLEELSKAKVTLLQHRPVSATSKPDFSYPQQRPDSMVS